MQQGPRKCNLARRIVVWVGLAICIPLLFWQLATFTSREILQVDDFVEYWAAGRLNLSGGNPYAPEELAPLQYAVGRRQGVPVMMWNPPFVLAIAMPLALLSYPLSRALWFLLCIAAMMGAADVAWRLVGGSARRRWLAWLIAFASIPTLDALQKGQISILMWLGVVGFLYCEKHGRDVLAGAWAILMALKPHLFYLFWIVFLLWLLSSRRWSVLYGLAAAGLTMTGIALAANPGVLGQYLGAAASDPPLGWATPTLGGLLRLILGYQKAWLQFAPLPIGLAWLATYWPKQRRTWCWVEQMPILLFVSVVTAAYGWVSDQVILLLAPLQIAVLLTPARGWRQVLTVALPYVLLHVAAAALRGPALLEHWYFWLGPAYLLWYAMARRLTARPAEAEGPDATGGLEARWGTP